MNIELGKTYTNRLGNVIEISGYEPNAPYYLYHDTDLNYYTRDGYFYPSSPSNFDLVQEYNEPEEETKDNSLSLYGQLELNEDYFPINSIWTSFKTDYDNLLAKFNPDTGELISIEKLNK
jgi:hypothetical protein